MMSLGPPLAITMSSVATIIGGFFGEGGRWMDGWMKRRGEVEGSREGRKGKNREAEQISVRISGVKMKRFGTD